MIDPTRLAGGTRSLERVSCRDEAGKREKREAGAGELGELESAFGGVATEGAGRGACHQSTSQSVVS